MYKYSAIFVSEDFENLISKKSSLNFQLRNKFLSTQIRKNNSSSISKYCVFKHCLSSAQFQLIDFNCGGIMGVGDLPHLSPLSLHPFPSPPFKILKTVKFPCLKNPEPGQKRAGQAVQRIDKKVHLFACYAIFEQRDSLVSADYSLLCSETDRS